MLFRSTAMTTSVRLQADAFSTVTAIHSRVSLTSKSVRKIMNGCSRSGRIRTTKVPSSVMSAGPRPSPMPESKSLSIPPPRFDVFSERLVGSWLIASSFIDIDTPSTATSTSRSVEEVMRSCGGAVQGLREPFVVPEMEREEDNNTKHDQGLYLNRANDGFLFVDEGNYSYGPTTFSTTNRNAGGQPQQPQPHFVSNFMLTKDYRVLLSCSKQQKHSLLRKQKFGVQNQDQSLDDDAKVLRSIDDPTQHIIPTTIHNIVTCSMPSSSHPWMLQRSKWTKLAFQVGESDEEIQEKRDENDGTTIYCWSSSLQSSNEFSEWMNISDNDIGDGQKEKRVVQQMGIFCKDSGQFQVSCRFYDSHSPDTGDGTISLSEVSCFRGAAKLKIE